MQNASHQIAEENQASVGRLTVDDPAIVLTDAGAITMRSVRRMPKAYEHDVPTTVADWTSRHAGRNPVLQCRPGVTHPAQWQPHRRSARMRWGLFATARQIRTLFTLHLGGTVEHFRVLLDDERCTNLIFHATSSLVQGEVPSEVVIGRRGRPQQASWRHALICVH